MKLDMRLAVFSGQIFWFDGLYYSTDEAFIKFPNSFSPYFESIEFCDATISSDSRECYNLSRNADVFPLPYFSVYSFWRNLLQTYPRIYRLLRCNMDRWDLVWLHAPHPVSLLFAYACKKTGTPFFFFIRQNLSTYVKHRNEGARRIAAVSAATVLEYIFRRLSKRTLTFAVGKEIYDTFDGKNRNVHNICASLVSREDIVRKPSRSQKASTCCNIVTVARLDPEKGVIYLIRAFDALLKAGRRNLVLNIVGTGTEQTRLQSAVRTRGLSDCVYFHGHVRHGPELWRLYRQSDVFVLPSLTEGYPQTLLEAMASGVAVVATRVGGVPGLITHDENGLLVPPACTNEIRQAIETVIEDPELRYRLVTNALSTVKKHTLEAERDRIMYHIRDFMESRDAAP